MRKTGLAVAAFVALPMCAGVIASNPPIPFESSRRIFYMTTQRVIALADGSQMLVFHPRLPDDKPPGMRIYIVSPDGPESDRSFSLEMLIPREIAAGYPGQIRSGAMSADHQWLAVVGGWRGAKDQRGHNGIFVLKLDDKGGKFWRLKSWFEVPDLAVGEVAFGSEDLLVATTQPHQPGSGAAPILTLFSYTGQRFGSFVMSPNHGERSSAALDMRIVRTGDRSYAVYDAETAQVRYVVLTAKRELVQTKTVALPFATKRINVIGFDPRPDGRVVIARTVVENQRGRTFVTVIDDRGHVVEEWEAPRSWRYGFVDERRLLHGFSGAGPPSGLETRTVTVR
jgi:hypothetical protein